MTEWRNAMRERYSVYSAPERYRSERSTGRKNIGFFGLLGIVFITLKLTGVIGWSWIWVLAPFWCPAILAGIGILALAFICYVTQ